MTTMEAIRTLSPGCNPPYLFEGPFGACYQQRAMCMDERHVFMVHGVLRAWPFTEALELGCFDGASSTAFIQAMRGTRMRCTFCDIRMTESLRRVVCECGNWSRVRMVGRPSWELLADKDQFDFILVDANHDVESVKPEIEQLVRRQPLCIMAHDTNATAAGYPDCEGAKLLKDTIRSLPAYRCLEDNRKRAGEYTERGLFFATTDAELYEKAGEVFDHWTDKRLEWR